MSINFGSGVEYLSATSAEYNVTLALSSSGAVVAYSDAARNDAAFAKYGGVSGSGITFGAEARVQPWPGDVPSHYIHISPFDDTTFVVSHLWQAQGSRGMSHVGTHVSGDMIAFGGSGWWQDTGALTYASTAALTSGTFVVAYKDNADSYYGLAKIGTVVGEDSVEFGNVAEFLSANGPGDIDVAALSPSSFVVVFADASDGQHGTAIVGTVSGSEITFGSPVEYVSADRAWYNSVVALNESQFVIAYSDYSDADHGTAIVGAVDGTTITFGTPEEFLSSDGASWVSIAKIDATRVAIAYKDDSDSGHGTIVIGTVAETSIIFTHETEFLSANNADHIAVAILDGTKCIVVYRDNNNSGHGTAKIGMLPLAQEIATASGNLYVGGVGFVATVGSVQQSDKMLYYHPCDSVIDGSNIPWLENILSWSGVSQFTSGRIGNAFHLTSGNYANMTDNGVGGYGNFGDPSAPDTPIDRATFAFWAQLSGSMSSWVGAGFTVSDNNHLQLMQVFPNGNLRLWVGLGTDDSKNTLTDFITIPDDGWHFHVVECDWTGSGWIVRHSVDGEDWSSSDEMIVSGMTYNSGGHEDTKTIILTGYQEETTKIDDVVLWKNADPLTLLELQILYLNGVAFNNGPHLYMSAFTNISGSCDLFLRNEADTITASCDLFLDGIGLSNTSGDLFIHGPELITASPDLFIKGPILVTSVSGEGNLFLKVPEPFNTSGDLFLKAPEPINASCDLFISAQVSGAAELGKPIDWLLRSADHNPQIIGTLEGAASVTIQIWDITNGQNTAVSVASSGCYQIGNTGRWGWSTSGLPTTQGHARHYFYMMTSNAAETFDGQFLMEVPEGAKWIHPSDSGNYLR